ncbi:hypothetical protein XENOCAPTIV_030842 [Xenoophorus captivus]|uniref:Sphingomyelin synthase-like domain-containing protein n=1 Tax=Xenoophorus captivus TaxID=1517983 RepID=A0ABV0QQ29_9TELE
MAASELIEEDEVRIPVEANVTSLNSPAQTHPQRVANGNPTHHALTLSPPADDHDGTNRSERSGLCSLVLIQSLNRKLKRRCEYEKICAKEEHTDRLPNEWWKTGVAFLYALFNLVFTTVVITIVHERVPDKSVSPPLPDKFFDYVDRVPWAFTVTETNGLILVGLWLIQWLFLKHKAIVGRRCFFLIGTLYMYRCVTMYITTLPVPGKHMVCAPKLYNDSRGKIWRILRLISGGGLSLTSSNLMCGDFLYSGHTVMLTLISGVICILVGHEHYSVDVVVAYFVTTRTFWWYHTMANTHTSLFIRDEFPLSLVFNSISAQELRGAPNNYLSRVWWNPVFNFLEKNVQTTVPVVFLSPRALLSSCKERYHTIGIERDE